MKVAIDGIRYGLDPKKLTANLRQVYKCSETLVLPSVVEYEGNTYEVVTLQDDAFVKCINLKTLTISKSINHISLPIQLPPSLEVVSVEGGNSKYDSRENCNAIIETKTSTLVGGCKNSTIPAGVTEIGFMAFYSCPIETIAIPSYITKIWAQAFRFSSLQTLKLPNSNVEVCTHAFSNCESLTHIFIPQEIVTIDTPCFSGCPALSSIVVDEENSMYDSRDNCNAIIETATNKLILGCQNTVIPSSVTSIEFAFQWCSSLKSIVIPDGVTIIGVCSFSECTSLEMVEIPKTVTEIGQYAFEECTSLVSIVYKGSIQEWEQIKKGDMWNFMVPAEVIHCVDGDIQNSADDTYNGGKVIKIHL
jgi:hypothetical protein